MHRRPEIDEDRFPLPPRATVIVLGTWVAVLTILAVFVVPLLFAPCAANIPPE